MKLRLTILLAVIAITVFAITVFGQSNQTVDLNGKLVKTKSGVMTANKKTKFTLIKE